MNTLAPIRVLFMGTPAFAVPALHALCTRSTSTDALPEWQVVGVVTQPDRPSGRGKRVAFSAVKEAALALHLPVLQPVSLRKDAAAVEALRALAPDLIVVAAYGLILPPAVLEMPTFGCVNVHASLLPAYRGASPIAAAILDGRAETGVTIMLMDEGMDTGPALSQHSEPILPDDTAETLGQRLAELGAAALVPTVEAWLAGTLAPLPQSELAGEPSIVRLIKKEAGRIDWQQAARYVERMTRAYAPWPGAYTDLNGAPLRIHKAAALDDEATDSAPGTVVRTTQGIGVATGDGILLLESVQPAGKRAMPASAFANGAPDFVGSVLGV